MHTLTYLEVERRKWKGWLLLLRQPLIVFRKFQLFDLDLGQKCR